MEQITGADLLTIRSQAVSAEDYAAACYANADRLSQAYLALQVENAKLRRLLAAARIALVQSGAHDGARSVGNLDGEERHCACDCGYDAAVKAAENKAHNA